MTEEVEVFAYGLSGGSGALTTAPKGIVVEVVIRLIELVTQTVVRVIEVNAKNG